MEMITTITLTNTLGSVNCYLAKTEGGFVLIDTGWASRRAVLDSELERAGCEVGALELIVITHGDFDHIGNCAYLSNKHSAQIAMHASDIGMAEKGDMFWNRKAGNFVTRSAAKLLFRLRKNDRFSPDLSMDEAFDLSAFGFDAKVLCIPGHSLGSVGVLTADGSLFCGDLFEHRKQPGYSSIMDDPEAAKSSFKKLSTLPIETVYPGHGAPFQMQDLNVT